MEVTPMHFLWKTCCLVFPTSRFRQPGIPTISVGLKSSRLVEISKIFQNGLILQRFTFPSVSLLA